LPEFIKFNLDGMEFSFFPKKRDLAKEKYVIRVVLEDSFGASTSYYFNIYLLPYSDSII
jgi:hypothetical protein